MKNILFAILLICSVQSNAQQGVLKPAVAQAQPADPTENMPKGEVHWISFQEALEKSKKEKRKILIDLYTDWCGWCKVMDKKTYGIKVIADYINKYYYAVKFDAEQMGDIQFKGTTFKHVGGAGRNGYHDLAFQMLQGQMSYPSTVFMDEDFNMINPAIPGYLSAEKIEPVLHYFAEDKIKQNVTWTDFLRNFKSELK